MITVTWYNLTAVVVTVVLILRIWWVNHKANQAPELGGLAYMPEFFMWIIALILFLAIWGGIFWW